MPPVEARRVVSYDARMKACLIYAALLGGALATSACLAEERVSKPAHATDSPAANPTEHAGGQEAAAPRGSDSSVHAPPDAAGEHPGVDHPDASVSKALKPDAGKPSPSAARAHGPRQPTANSHNDNARPPNPLDTRITVNQGRALENNRKGLVHKQEAPFDKANRTNAQRASRFPTRSLGLGSFVSPQEMPSALRPTPMQRPVA